MVQLQEEEYLETSTALGVEAEGARRIAYSLRQKDRLAGWITQTCRGLCFLLLLQSAVYVRRSAFSFGAVAAE